MCQLPWNIADDDAANMWTGDVSADRAAADGEAWCQMCFRRCAGHLLARAAPPPQARQGREVHPVARVLHERHEDADVQSGLPEVEAAQRHHRNRTPLRCKEARFARERPAERIGQHTLDTEVRMVQRHGAAYGSALPHEHAHGTQLPRRRRWEDARVDVQEGFRQTLLCQEDASHRAESWADAGRLLHRLPVQAPACWNVRAARVDEEHELLEAEDPAEQAEVAGPQDCQPLGH